MPFSARGENVKLGKGSMLLGLWAGTTPPEAFDFMGNANSVALSADVTNAELFSSTERSGSLVDRRPLRTAYTLTVSLNEYTVENLKLFLLGEEASESQALNATFETLIEGIQLGKWHSIGKRRMTGIEVYPGSGGSTALTSGTDYEVNAEFGLIKFLSGGAIQEGDNAFVNGAVPALTITKIRVAQESAPIAHIKFLCDDANNEGDAAKDELELWKVSVAPDGELNFISDEYGAFSLSMAVLSDATNHADDPYGTLNRITG